MIKEPVLEIVARNLENYFSGHNGAVVAYSGGVDSALLAYVTHRVLGNRMVAVIADSPSLARREYHLALKFARKHGIPLRIIRTKEMEDPRYRANPGNRCYYCKKVLFEKIEEVRRELERLLDESSLPVFFGANQDDLLDYRPGMNAAKEASVLSPYIELGINKKTIRDLSAYYGLEIANKPATPCMSSRIVYGEEVTLEKLNQIEKAEDFLYDLGLRELRVRHHGNTARIEVPPQDFGVILENHTKVSKRFHEFGFVYVSLDLDGFKSGSLNAILQ
jgi:uncharacterized protein